MQLKYHGGHCCGMRHLMGFSSFSYNHGEIARQNHPADERARLAYLTQVVRGAVNAQIPPVYNGPVADSVKQEFLNIMDWAEHPHHMQKTKCFEVIFTDSQFSQNPEWAQLLKDRGFEFKTRFKNNGTSWCNVFHRVIDPAYEDKKPPKWWTALKKTEEKQEEEKKAA